VTAADWLPSEPGEVVVPVLRHQRELIEDQTPDATLGLVSGYGAGKTRGAVLKALALGAANPGLPGMFVEPTYGMVEDVAIPEFVEVFDEWGFIEGTDWILNKRTHNLRVFADSGDFTIRFRSSENPRRLVGSNVAWAVLDEAEDHKEEAAKNVQSRIRHKRAPVRQFVAVGTPEGLGGWFHRWFETEPQEGARLIRASTLDNHFLPGGAQSYVDKRLGHLSEVERQRYVNGEFVALGGRVYTQFSPDVHLAHCVDPGAGEQVIAADFGRGCMAWLFARVVDDTEVHVHGEQVLENVDTWEAGERARRWWRDFFERRDGTTYTEMEAATEVTIYCDPAGSEAMKGSASDVRILRELGFNVRHRPKHPRIKDRVNSVQVKLKRRELFVDDEKAPITARNLAQQAYDVRGMPEKGRPRDGAKGKDHTNDALGYLIEYRWRAGLSGGNAYKYH
jgi:signal recognition particle subunit SEC65